MQVLIRFVCKKYYFVVHSLSCIYLRQTSSQMSPISKVCQDSKETELLRKRSPLPVLASPPPKRLLLPLSLLKSRPRWRNCSLTPTEKNKRKNPAAKQQQKYSPESHASQKEGRKEQPRRQMQQEM